MGRISNQKDYITLMVDEVRYESPDAVLVLIDGEKIWLPKSQLEDWPEVGTAGEIIIAEWLAKEKEMI